MDMHGSAFTTQNMAMEHRYVKRFWVLLLHKMPCSLIGQGYDRASTMRMKYSNALQPNPGSLEINR